MTRSYPDLVLAYLGVNQFNDHRTASDIGRGTGVTRGRAFLILRDFENRGLVRKTAKPKTGGLWELTRAGMAAVREMS